MVYTGAGVFSLRGWRRRQLVLARKIRAYPSRKHAPLVFALPHHPAHPPSRRRGFCLILVRKNSARNDAKNQPNRRWSESAGKRVLCTAAAGEAAGAVLESLDLAERVEDKSARRRQGLSLSPGAGAWTLLAATPCRLTSITVTWAGRIEKAAERAREVMGGRFFVWLVLF